MPERLQLAKHIAVGAKQTVKALQSRTAQVVYVAQDADAHITQPLRRQCEVLGVELVQVDTMANLGRSCRIQVGAAAAAVLQ